MGVKLGVPPIFRALCRWSEAIVRTRVAWYAVASFFATLHFGSPSIMTWFKRFVSSSIGKKQIVALTGALLILFLIAHLAGNLLIFVGRERFNEYSHALISNPLIYIAEVGLLALFLVHIGFTVWLTLDNRKARGPVAYAMVRSRGRPSRRSFASQGMIVSGALIFVFTVLHIMTFKYGAYHEAKGGPYPMRDLYQLVIQVFHDPVYVFWYVLCMVVLGLHLQHATPSLFETFGIDHPKWTPLILVGGKIFAWAIAIGFLLIPVLVFSSIRGVPT